MKLLYTIAGLVYEQFQSLSVPWFFSFVPDFAKQNRGKDPSHFFMGFGSVISEFWCVSLTKNKNWNINMSSF